MQSKSVIKVQMPPGYVSTNAILASGPKDGRVTFLAYSDGMKAKVLDLIVSGQDVKVSLYDGPACDGEWIE